MKRTLNIGAGRRVYKTYPTPEYECVNVDERTLSGIDYVCDVRKLRFGDEEFDFVLASDIIEHFPIKEVDNILTEWKRVLKVGGIIEFRLPNLEEIVADYLRRRNEDRSNGEPICGYFSWLIFGGQDYKGNFHYTGYDRRLFKHVCERNGLIEVSWKKEGYNMVAKMRKDK
jgi:predicted SAM-dependent methyltransferase